MRLKSAIWVSAFLRRCMVEGIFGALIRKGADGDVFQAVAARARLGEDLQAALQLQLVIGAEGACKAEVDILGVGCPTGGHRSPC